MIRSESASTSASTGSSEFQGFKVDKAGPMRRIDPRSDQVTPLPQKDVKVLNMRGAKDHEPASTASNARNARRARRRAEKRAQDHPDEPIFIEAVLPDEVHEVTCIREEYYPVMGEELGELQPQVLRPDVVLDNPFAVPESWEDSIDVEPTVTATMAMCIECCDHFDVALGAFVILTGRQENGWLEVKRREDGEDGWLPVECVECPQPGQVWAQVRQSPAFIQLPDQLEVKPGQHLLVNPKSEKNGWVQADEPLESLSGRVKSEWLDWLEL